MRFTATCLNAIVLFAYAVCLCSDFGISTFSNAKYRIALSVLEESVLYFTNIPIITCTAPVKENLQNFCIAYQNLIVLPGLSLEVLSDIKKKKQLALKKVEFGISRILNNKYKRLKDLYNLLNTRETTILKGTCAHLRHLKTTRTIEQRFELYRRLQNEAAHHYTLMTFLLSEIDIIKEVMEAANLFIEMHPSCKIRQNLTKLTCLKACLETQIIQLISFFDEIGSGITIFWSVIPYDIISDKETILGPVVETSSVQVSSHLQDDLISSADLLSANGNKVLLINSGEGILGIDELPNVQLSESLARLTLGYMTPNEFPIGILSCSLIDLKLTASQNLVD